MLEFFASGFTDIQNFFLIGLPSLLSEFLSPLSKAMVYAKLYSYHLALSLAIEVAQEILNDINLSQHIETAFNSLDSSAIHIANFFRIPDFIQIVFTGGVTKFILRIM